MQFQRHPVWGGGAPALLLKFIYCVFELLVLVRWVHNWFHQLIHGRTPFFGALYCIILEIHYYWMCAQTAANRCRATTHGTPVALSFQMVLPNLQLHFLLEGQICTLKLPGFQTRLAIAAKCFSVSDTKPERLRARFPVAGTV